MNKTHMLITIPWEPILIYCLFTIVPGGIYVGEDTSALETLGMHCSVLCSISYICASPKQCFLSAVVYLCDWKTHPRRDKKI